MDDSFNELIKFLVWPLPETTMGILWEGGEGRVLVPQQSARKASWRNPSTFSLQHIRVHNRCPKTKNRSIYNRALHPSLRFEEEGTK